MNYGFDFEMPDNDAEYPEISEKEIYEALNFDPIRAGLMALANASLNEAKEKRMWKPREPEERKSGWEIVLHDGTEESAVALWSSWLENQLYLGYPKKISVPDELIMKILNVERAQRVRNVAATAVTDENYNGEYKDPDKPLERNGCGQIVAYRDEGTELWTQFWGPKEEKGGRVWIKKSEERFCSAHNSIQPPIIKNEKELVTLFFGFSQSHIIYTYPWFRCNKYATDSPTADREAIQRYREKFLELLVETACLSCEPTKLTINYKFVMVPEDLEREDYQNIQWLKGTPGIREGMENELVRAEKPGEIIMLQSHNSIVPWATIRQIDIPEDSRNKKDLYTLIKDSLIF